VGVLTRPRDLPEDLLASALARGWDVGAASMSYRPLGFGSHHWEVTDTGGSRWFLTADELESKRRSRDEPLTVTFARLRAALRAARDLRETGAGFVVAPVRARDREPLLRVTERFAVALYPFVTGRSFEWGRFAGPAHRRAVFGLIVATHTAPAEARRSAGAEDFVIPHRDELESALGPGHVAGAGPGEASGPYERPAAALLAGNAGPLRRLLARYDELAADGRARPAGMTLTHGEPHPGNTMLTADGWVLVDWDTALLAPPERDLWALDPGDGSVLRRYAEATGVTPRPPMLELYRIRWDLADLAVAASRFRGPHDGSPDDRKSWDELRALVARLADGSLAGEIIRNHPV
jgi:Phosphotransferase enzyme family